MMRIPFVVRGLLVIAALTVIVLLAAASLPGEAPEVRGAAPPNLDGYDFEFHGMLLSPPRPAPDFSLTDQHNRPFRLSGQRGRVVVLFFGYTTCPDVCPTTLAHFSRVRDLLGNAADHVDFLFVSVDPERDTPERLTNYIGHFDESIKGLWGSREELEQVWHNYGVYVERVDAPESAFEYWVNHTSLSYVINADGLVIVAHPFGIPAEKVAADLAGLVEQAGATAEGTLSVQREPGSEDAAVRTSEAWARPGAEGGNSAVYVELENTGSEGWKVVAAETAVAATVELHRTAMEMVVGPDGIPQQRMSMQQVAAIEVPAGESVALQPGGLHIMLFDLQRDLAAGDTFSLVLHGDGGLKVPLEVVVRTATGVSAGAGH